MSGDSSRFRAAEAKDVEAILSLMATYYAEDGYPFSRTIARGQLERLRADPTLGCVWVSDSAAGDVVGYLVVTLGFSFEYGGRDAFVDELYIAEPRRGAGLGREALRCAEAYCRRVGVRAIHLEVERHRVGVDALYAKEGFRETGRKLLTKRLD